MSTGLLFLLVAASGASAQAPCRGDVDDDGVVGLNDLVVAEIIVFMEADDLDPGTAMRADANADGSLTAADLTAIAERQGFMCPPGPSRTPTPTLTRTGTPTRTASFTPTRTPIPTPTPTQVCAVQQVTPGVTNGTLAQTDCRRVFGASARLTDVYSMTAAAGQGIKIEVEATGSGGTYPPYVRVIDPNGYFDDVEGAPPIEFRSTTTLPYLIQITSSPMQAQQVGSYRMTISSKVCEVFVLRTGQIKSFDGTECPDPTSPSVGDRIDLADVYTFDVVQPLSPVEILMEQSQEDSQLDPIIAVFGPSGYEVFPSFQADDAAPGGFGFDALARFAAVEIGTYTVIASAGGCDPREVGSNCGYRLIFRAPSCLATPIGDIPSTSRKVLAGTLYGDTNRTACRAPVTIPGFNEIYEPEVSSPADVYTFNAAAGDIISAEMDSDGDSQLSLFGPVQGGNPFITQNDVVDSSFVSQLATTLTQDGTYTLIALNRTFLEPPEPNEPPEELGEFVEYEAFVQKCPVSGGLLPATGNVVNGRFRVTDCVGFGNYPFKSYAFDGTAGQVVSTTMASPMVDAALSVLSANRSTTFNDDDATSPPTTNARTFRVLPTTGTYFAETTSSRDEFEPDLAAAPAFTTSARSCPVKPIAVGTLSDSFIDGDCDLGDGRKYDVYTLDGVGGLPARPFVMSVQPPANACIIGMLPGGPQLYAETCTKAALDIPVVGSEPAGFVIVADAAATRGAYSARVRVCGVPTVGFGANYSASLATAGCADPDGARSDWILVSDKASLVRFNEGISLTLEVGFAAVPTIIDVHQVSAFTSRRNLDDADLIPLGSNLAALVKIQGATLNDRGPYTLRVIPPLRQQ